MRRRDFIASALGGTASYSTAAWAQQAGPPLIGFLNSASAADYLDRVQAFHSGLRENGWVEGRTVAIDYRWASGKNELLPRLTAELLDRKVAVIVAGGGAAAVVAKQATSAVPIVFTTAFDPVQAGLVASLNRPGGNATGATNLNLELGSKRLEVLRELIPLARKVGLLVNPSRQRTAEAEFNEVRAAAAKLGLDLHLTKATSEREADAVIADLRDSGIEGLLFGSDAFLNSLRLKLGELTERHRIPAVHFSPEFVTAGGLASLGGDGREAYRIAGSYAGRILKGEKPSDLPVQQATTVRLRLNLRTAKALGIEVPITLLARADEVIE